MNPTRFAALVRLDLTQRVRSVAWYVMLGVFALVLCGATALAFLAFSSVPDPGAGVYSVVVYIVLLLVVLVSPTLSGNAINGDRDAATLAPVQVTLATTGEIVLGKFVAAWITGLAFVAVSVPFMVVAAFAGGVDAVVVLVSLLIIIVETGVIAAIGIGLSGILARPLFSVAATYLVVSALVIGTVIAFGLAGAGIRSEATSSSRSIAWDENTGQPVSPPRCGEWQVSTYEVPRFDQVWWMLAPNPFVVLADATPARFDRSGNPVDLFGILAVGIRGAQQPPALENTWDDCGPTDSGQQNMQSGKQIYERSMPSWFVGLGIQLVIAGGLLGWAYARTRTPARTLPPGTRIA